MKIELIFAGEERMGNGVSDPFVVKEVTRPT